MAHKAGSRSKIGHNVDFVRHYVRGDQSAARLRQRILYSRDSRSSFSMNIYPAVRSNNRSLRLYNPFRPSLPSALVSFLFLIFFVSRNWIARFSHTRPSALESTSSLTGARLSILIHHRADFAASLCSMFLRLASPGSGFARLFDFNLCADE